MSNDSTLAMLDAMSGYFKTQIVYALASLCVADYLAERPVSLVTLVEKTGTHPDGLRRLFRAAASMGLLWVEDNDIFASTPMLDTLRGESPLRAMAIVHGSPCFWQPWGRLIEAVKTGEAQSITTLGLPFFDYVTANPAQASVFSKAMQATSQNVQAEVLRLVDTSNVATVADIGGANGALVCAIVAAKPALKGIIFDLPHSLDSAVAFIRGEGLADRVKVVSGDFFESVPAADLYLLKYILHDWDDAACVKLLTNCRSAMSNTGRVAIVEMRLGPMGKPSRVPFVDLMMLVTNGGRERTSEEYGKLLAQAGLKLASVKDTSTPFSILEAVCA
jgi:hypothetical protein